MDGVPNIPPTLSVASSRLETKPTFAPGGPTPAIPALLYTETPRRSPGAEPDGRLMRLRPARLQNVQSWLKCSIKRCHRQQPWSLQCWTKASRASSLAAMAIRNSWSSAVTDPNVTAITASWNLSVDSIIACRLRASSIFSRSRSEHSTEEE